MAASKTFADLEKRAFRLHNFDIENLRNLYRRLQSDLPRAFIYQMKREPLVNSILAAEFGGEFLMAYQKQTAEWDEMKRFVENSK